MSSRLIYDENSLVDDQLYKYDKYLHSRINRYTDDARTLVTYFNVNETHTTTSLGMNMYNQTLGPDSPFRFDQIENMIILGLSMSNPEETNVSNTEVRDININGEAFIIPGTIMPHENDFFILKHINMNHLFRVSHVDQDKLISDGAYRIQYDLFSTNPQEIDWIYKQTVNKDPYIMDLQTIGGEDLTPVIGKTDYELRHRLLSMIDDMIESYVAQFYDKTHNCFICHLNGESLFDLCGNKFMARHGIMMRDNSIGNIVLNENKTSDPRIEMLYQKSPYKWIERDAPIRYLDTFKYHLTKSWNFPDSSFARYGTEVDVMIPNDPWCSSTNCRQFFPTEVYEIFDNKNDIRLCDRSKCKTCPENQKCHREFKIQRYDYISIIHDFIHGMLTKMDQLSLYTGDQLFDLSMSKEIYLWTPIIIYIIKQTLKIK